MSRRRNALILSRTIVITVGADGSLEVVGVESTFRLAWECARPNATVTVVALMIRLRYCHFRICMEKSHIQNRWRDGCDCEEP